MLRPWRKPLVIFSPKSLLRHKEAVSTVDDLANGQFQRVITGSSQVDPAKVKRVLLCTGKVYYDLLDTRRKLGREDVAIVRLEQLYPINEELARVPSPPFKDGTRLMWVQEEPRNMGPWYFMNANLPEHHRRPPCRCRSCPAPPPRAPRPAAKRAMTSSSSAFSPRPSPS